MTDPQTPEQIALMERLRQVAPAEAEDVRLIIDELNRMRANTPKSAPYFEGMNVAESNSMLHLVEAWTYFSLLTDLSREQNSDFLHAINECQRILMSRAFARLHPHQYHV